jgi:N-dimethylarginine dimethylaminohydrolase
MATTPKREISNGHSMVGALHKVVVCPPQAAGWNDRERVAQSRDLGFPRPPKFELAQQQHGALCDILRAVGVEILEMAGSPDLTLDAVYAHDSSLPTDFGVILMNPGKRNRAPETSRHRAFCEQAGIPVLGEIRAPGTTEAGDMVWMDDHTLLIGRGYRTNAAGIAQMRELLQPHGVEVLATPLPHGSGPAECLHLMSLISLLDEETALVDLPWLAVETVELLQEHGYRFIEIDASERRTLACNVLTLGDRRLAAIAENQNTNQRLRAAGFEVFTFAGSEICINGAGGPTCLTRPLLRG